MQNIFRAKYFYMHQNASCVDSQQRQSLTETACINMSRVSMQCPFCKASISSTKKLNLGRFRYACDGQHSTAPLRWWAALEINASIWLQSPWGLVGIHRDQLTAEQPRRGWKQLASHMQLRGRVRLARSLSSSNYQYCRLKLTKPNWNQSICAFLIYPPCLNNQHR